MAELSALTLPRVAGFAFEPQGQGFAALARRAGLKPSILPAVRAALIAIKTSAGEPGDGLKLSLVQKVIDHCERLDDPALVKVQALLWRFAAEAAKTEAASFAREAAASGFRLPANPRFLACQRRRRSGAEIARRLLTGSGRRGVAGAQRTAYERRSGTTRRTAARACRPARRRGLSSSAWRCFVGAFGHRSPRLRDRLTQH